jgi:iron complex transport system substrate-binding protein
MRTGFVGRTVLALTALALSWCAPANAADPPRRVASFNVCADQLVLTLADPEQIIGLSPYASDPAISTVADKAQAYPRLALQAEAMVPLKPDLVLVGTWDRPLTQRMLRSLGFRVVGVDVVSDVEAGVVQIREMAKLLGHPERGEALIADIEAARRRLAAAPRPRSSSALLIGNSGYTVGPNSLAGALLREAGLVPPPGAPGGYGGYVPLEKLIMLQPDFLVMSSLIETPDGQGALYLTHPALRALYPTDKRIVLPSRFTLCAGPSLVAAFDYLTDVVTRLASRK